jgi:Transposase, Mutator family
VPAVVVEQGRSKLRAGAAFMAAAFAQDDARTTKTIWRKVAAQPRQKLPNLSWAWRRDIFPKDYRRKIYSAPPLERPNGEIKRSAEVVGILQNEDAIVRLIGAIPLEWNDEFAERRASSMTLETLAPLRDVEIVGLPAATAWPTRPTPPIKAIMPLKPHPTKGHHPGHADMSIFARSPIFRRVFRSARSPSGSRRALRQSMIRARLISMPPVNRPRAR